jgi:Flp pilus assembly protein TadG
MRTMHSPIHPHRGLAIVEFVIVLPLLLVLMLAVAEFGRAFLQYNTLTQGLHSGVRHVVGNAMYGSTGNVILQAHIVAETRNVVVFGTTAGTGTPRLPGLSPADVEVTSIGGGYIRVTARYRYVPIMSPLPLFGSSGTIDTLFTFRASIVGRAL